MAIHASANPANIRRSIEKYLADTFVGVSAFPAAFAAERVWWPGAKIETEGLPYFLRVSFRETLRDFYSAGRDSQASYITSILLMLEVWVARVSYRTNPHVLQQALATLRGGLARGQAINIRNYDSGDGTTIVGIAVVETASPPDPQEEGEWSRVMWDVTLSYIERDTTS